MADIASKQLGEFLRHQTQDTVEKDRDTQATITAIPSWATTGEVRATLLNGDLIWVSASGNLQELAVGDVIWVRKFGVGRRSQYRMTGFFKQAGGTYKPASVRADVLSASKVSELWASDGTPQAIDVDASGVTKAGDISGGTNVLSIAADGTLTFGGASAKTQIVQLPLVIGGGTATIEAFLGAPSINLDADLETFIVSFRVPSTWNAASNLTLVMMVANEIAETDGDDVSITCQVRGYADGETMSDAGQAVACLLDLTGGDEAINVVNRVTGAIVYNDGTYPIAAGDVVIVEATVNLAAAGECTGPLHVVGWWVEFTRDRLGT